VVKLENGVPRVENGVGDVAERKRRKGRNEVERWAKVVWR